MAPRSSSYGCQRLPLSLEPNSYEYHFLMDLVIDVDLLYWVVEADVVVETDKAAEA